LCAEKTKALRRSSRWNNRGAVEAHRPPTSAASWRASAGRAGILSGPRRDFSVGVRYVERRGAVVKNGGRCDWSDGFMIW